MKVIYNKLIPFKGFYAITIIKWIFVRKEYEKYKGERMEKIMINHESIHEAQILDFSPSWVPSFLRYIIGSLLFYPLYLFNWLILLIKQIYTLDNFNAYENILAEKEAYANEKDDNYLSIRKRFNWLKRNK